jgi:Mg2+ and Co2+ transporter CorA|tara:strand:+ start:1265 stop:1546 length:282 start_codon:yes stop_codon:yes gene_type:complete
MIQTIIISVLGVLVVILGFTTFNLLRKNEKQEDILAGYITYLDQFSRIIELSDEKLKKIDERGIFKSDDEVGFMYEQIKELQRVLSNFRVEKL